MADLPKMRKLLERIEKESEFIKTQQIKVRDKDLEKEVVFEPEVFKKTISKNEVQLDGRFTAAGGDIYFDIKGFDLVDRMTSDLQNELNQAYPDYYFTIGGKADVSYKDMDKALRDKRSHIKTLVDDNRKNEEFFLKNATQYTPDRPFLLICTMTSNFLLFDRYTTLRAIARRAFIHLLRTDN